MAVHSFVNYSHGNFGYSGYSGSQERFVVQCINGLRNVQNSDFENALNAPELLQVN